MRVCLDIQSAIGARAGVGRYTKLLAEHLAPLRGANNFSLFHFDFHQRGHSLTTGDTPVRSCRWMPGRFAQKAWKTIGWPPYDWFSGSADVFHFPNFIRPPLKHGASVVTIHDLAFLRFPETIEEKNLAYLKGQIEQTVRNSTAIITVSEFTAREARELLNVPESKLHPIHSGLDPALAAPHPGCNQGAAKTSQARTPLPALRRHAGAAKELSVSN
ncbi:MAG: glycosyltransferase [Kiritimatiellae bacterium]|nr:glycosyltransferase [Kiritimatiellia bacterium]